MISSYIYKSAGATHQYHKDAYNLTVVTGEGIANESVYATWGGKGALYAGLGIDTRVEGDAFLEHLKGHVTNPITRQVEQIGGYRKDPETGESMWRHPPGLELVFSPPKSFSIMALSGGDARLRAAFPLAVAHVMAYAEREAGIAKVSIAGNKIDRTTGNLLWADFPHETSRHLDEQLHTHKAVLNVTFDNESKQWRALNNHKLLGMVTSGRLDQMLMSELRTLTEQLGYRTIDSAHSAKVGGWEIAGIPRDLILDASRSKQAAQAYMTAEGKDYQSALPREKQSAHYASRPDKTRVARPELLADWQARAERHGVDLPSMRAEALGRTEMRADRTHLAAAQSHLIDALKATDGNAVLPAQLIADTLTRASGQTTLHAVEQAYAQAIKAGALHELQHNGMVSTSRQVANTVTRSADPKHVTAGMRKLARHVAKKHGIEPPKSKDPAVWRAFLDEHSSKRLSAPTRTLSAKTLEKNAARDKDVDGKLANILDDMRVLAARLPEFKAAQQEAMALTGPAATAAQAKAAKDIERAESAGAMLTARQLGEKLTKAYPEIKLFEANKAVERATEKGQLFVTELARKDETPEKRAERLEKYRDGQSKDLAAFDKKQAEARAEFATTDGANLVAFDAAQKHARTEFTAKQDTLRDRYENRQESETYQKFSVIDHSAPVDRALSATLADLKETVAAGKVAAQDLKDYLAENRNGRDTAQAQALQAKIDAGAEAGRPMTGSQLAQKVAAQNPDIDKFAVQRAIAVAAEKGELHSQEHAKPDGSGIYHKFSVEPQESRLDQAQALMAKDRSPAEETKFRAELAKAMGFIEEQARDKQMISARAEAHSAGSRYGDERTPAYHDEYERVMARAEKKELILDKQDVAQAVIRADRAVEAWKDRGGEAGDRSQAADREALKAVQSESRQTANKSKLEAIKADRDARNTKIKRYAANAASPKDWEAVKTADRKGFAAELNNAAKDFEANWAQRRAQAVAPVEALKTKLDGARAELVGNQKDAVAALDARHAGQLSEASSRADKTVAKLKADYATAKQDAGGSLKPEQEKDWQARIAKAGDHTALREKQHAERGQLLAKHRDSLSAFDAKQANRLGAARDQAVSKLRDVNAEYKAAKHTFDDKQKEQVDRWQESREGLQKKWEHKRETRWKLPSMAIKTRNTGWLNRDAGLGRGVYRAELSLSNALNLLVGNKDQVTYKKANVLYASVIRANRVVLAVRQPVERKLEKLNERAGRALGRGGKAAGRWIGKKVVQGLKAATNSLRENRQYDKAAKTLGMIVTRPQDNEKAKSMGYATKSVSQRVSEASKTSGQGKTHGQDFMVEMFGTKEQKAELAQRKTQTSAQTQGRKRDQGNTAGPSRAEQNKRVTQQTR